MNLIKMIYHTSTKILWLKLDESDRKETVISYAETKYEYKECVCSCVFTKKS